MGKKKDKGSDLPLKERLEKRRKEIQSNSGGGDFDWMSIKEGETRMRPVPVGEDVEPGIEVIVFYLGKELGYVLSPATFDEPCAIMEKWEEMNKGDEDDKEIADKFKPKKKFMMPHYRYEDTKGKKPDTKTGVKLLMLTQGLYDEVLGYFLDEDDWGDFTDPKNGYDLKYIRRGTGKMDTEYSTSPCKPTKADKEFTKEEHDPAEMVKEIMPTYEKTESIIETYLGESSEDEDEEKPKKKKKKEKKGKKKKK